MALFLVLQVPGMMQTIRLESSGTFRRHSDPFRNLDSDSTPSLTYYSLLGHRGGVSKCASTLKRKRTSIHLGDVYIGSGHTTQFWCLLGTTEFITVVLDN